MGLVGTAHLERAGRLRLDNRQAGVLAGAPARLCLLRRENRVLRSLEIVGTIGSDGGHHIAMSFLDFGEPSLLPLSSTASLSANAEQVRTIGDQIAFSCLFAVEAADIGGGAVDAVGLGGYWKMANSPCWILTRCGACASKAWHEGRHDHFWSSLRERTG